MANILGTNIAAPIVPFSTLDIYASHEALYGKGGWRTVSDTTERDAIPELRRENLMIVAVATDGTSGDIIYQLVLGTVDNDLTNNSNWVEFEVGSGGDEWLLPPPISTFAPGTVGQRSYDEDFIYICIQTNTWKRVSMDYFSINLSTSGTSGSAVLELEFGDVPIFGNNTWTFDPVVKQVYGTSGIINVIYSDNTVDMIDFFGTNGAVIPPLSSVLGIGNVSGSNDILIDNGQKLITPQVQFDSSVNNSAIIDLNSTSGIYFDQLGNGEIILTGDINNIANNYFQMSQNIGELKIQDNNNNLSFIWASPTDITLTTSGSNGRGFEIVLFNDSTTENNGVSRYDLIMYDGGGGIGTIMLSENNISNSYSTRNIDNWGAIIGSRNSTILQGIVNSVILGGDTLNGSNSNTVFVPNLELQGNVLGKYTIQPNTQPGWDDLSIPTKKYVDDNITASTSGTIQILTPDDKFLTALITSIDGDLATNDFISNIPTDGSYIAVFVNGQEFEVGNGVTNKACYFSNDGGTSGRGFDSTHINGQVQTGDLLYWNGSISGTQLLGGWRISYLYTIDR